MCEKQCSPRTAAGMDYRRGRDMAEKAHGPGVLIGQVYLNLTKDQRKIFTNTNFYLAHLTLNSKQQIPQNERALKASCFAMYFTKHKTAKSTALLRLLYFARYFWISVLDYNLTQNYLLKRCKGTQLSCKLTVNIFYL